MDAAHYCREERGKCAPPDDHYVRREALVESLQAFL